MVATTLWLLRLWADSEPLRARGSELEGRAVKFSTMGSPLEPPVTSMDRELPGPGLSVLAPADAPMAPPVLVDAPVIEVGAVVSDLREGLVRAEPPEQLVASEVVGLGSSCPQPSPAQQTTSSVARRQQCKAPLPGIPPPSVDINNVQVAAGAMERGPS